MGDQGHQGTPEQEEGCLQEWGQGGARRVQPEVRDKIKEGKEHYRRKLESKPKTTSGAAQLCFLAHFPPEHDGCYCSVEDMSGSSAKEQTPKHTQ